MEESLVIIPNTIEPYGYETIPILTYPDGFEYRFRFEEEWVDNSLEHRLSKLTNCKGYIILREFDTGSLFPLRHFQVNNAEKIGKIYYIQIKLLGLVAYDSQNDHRNNQLTEFNKKFFDFNSKYTFNNLPGEDMRPLVFLTNFECTIKNLTGGNNSNKHMENWGNILSCFKNINFFNNVQFLRILSVNPIDSGYGSSNFADGTLILKEGADYEIKIAQFITKSSSTLSPSDIKIEADDKAISVLRGNLRAVGKYDILAFIIRANSGTNVGASFLDILYLPKPVILDKDSTSSLAGDPRLSIPVKIERNPKVVYQRSLFLFLFTVLYFCPGFIPIIPWPWLATKTEFFKDISIIGITVSFISLLSEFKRTNK